MSAERLEAIDRIVGRGIAGGGFPGAAVVIGHDGYAVLQKGYGHQDWQANSRPVSPEETMYDMASLTKVVATTTAAMILYDEGKLPLDAPVRQFIPEFTGGLKDKVTVRQLLLHRSGLPAGRVLWGKAKNPADAKRMEIASQIQCDPGSCFNYSDVGADMLGWVIESIAHQSLDQFATERVFTPLGMRDTHFRPDRLLRDRIAPTQDESRRGYALRGEVQDESAYVLGGVVGHAGLFSTAADVALFAQMLLNNGQLNGRRIVAESTVRLFTKDVADARALGWETANHVHGAGDLLGPHAYGHTGYTGTSIWIDPDRKLFIVILTNRTFAPHSRHPADAIADVRNDVADAATLAIADEPSLANSVMPASFRSDTAHTWNVGPRPAWRAAAEKRARVEAARRTNPDAASVSRKAGAPNAGAASASPVAKPTASAGTPKPAASTPAPARQAAAKPAPAPISPTQRLPPA